MSNSGASTAGLSPDDSPATAFNAEKIGKFGYGIGISVGILLLITTITLMSYFCTRYSTTGNSSSPSSRRRSRSRPRPGVDDEDDDIEAGVDEATLKSWEKVTYAEAKRRDPRAGDAGCSVCLADYEEEEVLRLLPECGHLFHARCVDPWLRRRSSCPVCRASPVPSPLPTPLAEVVPLAAAR